MFYISNGFLCLELFEKRLVQSTSLFVYYLLTEMIVCLKANCSQQIYMTSKSSCRFNALVDQNWLIVVIKLLK